MKSFLLLLTFGMGLHGLVHAQSTDSSLYESPVRSGTTQQRVPGPKKSPPQRAAQQLKVLATQLNLTQDQVIQLRMILLNRVVALDSIINNPSGDPKADGKTRKAINQDVDARIYALLNADQKSQYTQWKIDQKEKAEERKKARMAGSDSTQSHINNQ
jgi:periplasmic protein CpxP/Spy